MIRAAYAFLLMLMPILTSGTAAAHGVHGEVHVHRDMVFILKYQDGHPFAHADYAIYRDGEAVAHTRGATDSEGRIIFSHTETGPWHLQASRPDGHVVDITFEAPQGGYWEQTVSPPAALPPFILPAAALAALALAIAIARRPERE